MNDYFQARGVNPQMYKNTKLPAYFKEVIESLPSQSKVLDFGCGFGQNLLALKEKNFDFSGGGVIRTFISLVLILIKMLLRMCRV
ncbi:methionine biosynthesis protein MetW [Helicobacter japonicus]|uniref:methionine biosynthesis protein MetW n=1 Tax=Helicobacter japonicus TaxID=425400 RepID=UPI0023577CD7|nr:methionine biosynthesis protein MetW [Helicobacter japonicus]